MSENPMSAKEKKELLSYLETAMDLEGRVLELSRISKGQRLCMASLVEGTSDDIVPLPPYLRTPAQEAKDTYGGRCRKKLKLIGAILGLLFAIWDVRQGWDWLWRQPGALLYAWLVVAMELIFCSFVGFIAGLVIGWLIDRVRVSHADANIKNQRVRAMAHFEDERARSGLTYEEARRKQENDIRYARDVRDAVKEFKKDQVLLDSTEKIMRELLITHYKGSPINRKYRTFPAICKICETIDSECCNSLEAAYDQYECELRLGRIEDKRGSILVNLKDIEHSQQTLYDRLTRIGAEAKLENEELSHCASNLDISGYSDVMRSLCESQTSAAASLLFQIEHHKKRLKLPFERGVYEGKLITNSDEIVERAHERMRSEGWG